MRLSIAIFTGSRDQRIANDPALGPEYPECLLSAYRCDGFVDCPGDNINDENDKFCPDNSVSSLLATCASNSSHICMRVEMQ